MSYLSLARKYRPQNFDEILGQEHIATTLKNAIKMDMISHAYLFAGPRGVGKTSTARILAKSLNCEKGPTQDPCNKCVSCKEITDGRGMDVIEIDGASNRGIDEIRNIKENIKFASIHGKFRIYIIDEVHMLTQEAFNALLKTLEEPPAHVKFIFATTRPHKVLATIVSRCQRFDFRKISAGDIVKKLEEIKKIEKLNLENDTMFLIAKASDGSLRDAEVILDQLLSFSKGKIKKEDVTSLLGLMEESVLSELADSIAGNDKEKVLSIINTLINNGKDPVFIAESIISYFRNLMIAKVTKSDSRSYSDLSEDDYNKLEEIARKFSIDDVLYITYSISSAIDLMKKTNLSRIPLEICLIKLTEKERLLSIKEILARLSLLEKKINLEEDRLATKKLFIEPTVIPEKTESPIFTKNPITVPKEEISQEKDIILFQKVKSSWAKVINFIKGKKISIGTYLAEGRLLKVKNNVLNIGFYRGNALHKEIIEENTNKKFVEESVKNIIGEDLFIQIESIEGEENPDERPDYSTEDRIEEAVEASSNKIDSIVESVLDVFGGRVIDVRENSPKGRKN